MRPQSRLLTFIPAVVAFSVVVAGCGSGATAGGSASPGAPSATGTPPASGVAASGGVAPTTRHIEGPGTWQTSVFRPTVTFTLPEHWSSGQAVNTFAGADESATGLPLTNGVATVTVSAPKDLLPPAPGDPGTVPVPADLMAWLRSHPGLSLSAPTDVTIAGVKGTEVEGQLSPTAKIPGEDVGFRLTDYLIFKEGQHFRLAVLPIGGHQVVVATIAPADRWDEQRPLADAVVGSLSFASS